MATQTESPAHHGDARATLDDKENIRPLEEKDGKVLDLHHKGTLTQVRKKKDKDIMEMSQTPETPPSTVDDIPDFVTSVPKTFVENYASHGNFFQFPPPGMLSFTPSTSQLSNTSVPPPFTPIVPSMSLSHPLSPLSPPFSPLVPPHVINSWPAHSGMKAVVEQGGWISLSLRHDVVLDISARQAIRLKNTSQGSSLSLSCCTSQMALVHPKGRVLQYGPRVEVQTEDRVSVKNAKIYPRGVSFTANNCALVYLLDEAGARTTSDMFHDLFATQISDSLFLESCQKAGPGAVEVCVDQLEMAEYWQSVAGVDFWDINKVRVQQTRDGLVTVERELEGDRFLLKASPGNGKVRFESRSAQVTASLGKESHLFLRSRERRLHYSGETTVFTVRNAGHSAGFDEDGSLRIF